VAEEEAPEPAGKAAPEDNASDGDAQQLLF